MAIYISYHPIDSHFVAELTVYLRNYGFAQKLLPLICDVDSIKISKSDVVLVILRPEYIKSPSYFHLSEYFSNTDILPVLRTPIGIEDWSETITLNPIADFSSRDAEQILLNMSKLAKLLTQYVEPSNGIKPNTKEIYAGYLESCLQQVYFPFNALDQMSYGCVDTSRLPIHTLLENMEFKISSIKETIFVKGNYNRERMDQLENIAKYHDSFAFICDYLDSRLVAVFMVNVIWQQSINSSSKTLPLILDIENLSKEVVLSEWLDKQLSLGDILLENLTFDHFVLYVYGFEHSSINVHQFRQDFREWRQHNSPPLTLVIVSPYLDDDLINNPDDFAFIVRPIQYNLAHLKQVCSKYSNRSFAQFILGCADNDENVPVLRYFLENPIFATALLSITFEENIEFSQQKLGDFFQYFIANLWKIEIDAKSADFSGIGVALSKIAAIVTERQKSFVTYDEALKFFRSDLLLNKCIDRGLFLSNNNMLRFSTPIIQDYFTAIALAQYGIPAQLPHLVLTSHGDRVPQQWDNSVIISSHITSTHDEMVTSVADVDPVLALRCLSNGIQFSTAAYSYVIDANLNSLVGVGDFRLIFARLLYKIDQISAKAILVEVLRNAQWSNRVYAYSLFQELDASIMPGLVESLADITDQTRTKVSRAIQRIGSNTLPTIFHLLLSDNGITRLNAIWAMRELKDKACVPALVRMLLDNNSLVVIQAVDTLRTLHDIHSVPYLIGCLQHRQINVRKVVINALVEIQSNQSECFVEIIRQMDAASRRQLVVSLSTSQANALLDFLLVFSYDEDLDVKIAAIEGLATIAEPRVVSRLEECLGDMSKSRLYKSSVNEIVSKILSNISGYSNGKTISNKGQDNTKALSSSQIVKSRLMNAKEQRTNESLNLSNNIDLQSEEMKNALDISKTNDQLSPEDAYVSDILAQLRSGKWNTSSNAAKTLREYVKTLRGTTTLKVMNQILETLNDDDWVIRWTGVETLGWVGNVHVVPHLIQRLTDSNWKVKIAAIRALVEIKDKKAIISVSNLLSDNNALVRETAAEALGYLDGSQAIVALESAVLDSEEFVRLAAIESLGKKHDKVATGTLLFALQDSSEHVRWAAANALTGIADADLVSVLIPSLSDSAGPYWEQKRICDVIVDILKQIDTDEAKIALIKWQSSQA